MRLSELSYGARGRCFHCGESIGQAGYWNGRGGELIVCPEDDCIRALLHTAIDAISDMYMGDINDEVRHIFRCHISEAVTEKLEGR